MMVFLLPHTMTSRAAQHSTPTPTSSESRVSSVHSVHSVRTHMHTEWTSIMPY